MEKKEVVSQVFRSGLGLLKGMYVTLKHFINLTVFPELCRGHKLADVVIVLESIDIIMGEVDR